MSLKLATFAAALAGASAFVPSTGVKSVAKSSSALKMGFETEIGAQPPLGFWDPLGLLNNATQERFDRLRYVETKHGRIAMLAILGHLVTTAGARWPIEGLDKIPTGLAGLTALQGNTLVIFYTIGLLEVGFLNRKDEIEAWCEKQMSTKYGWSEDFINKKRAIELNNGRAAQMGILALMVHEMLDGNPYIINSLLGFPVDFNAGL
ncbi:unnamed protein product [Heterosigma akashiwo]|mmetsp:Transcript_4524/g.6403  ORF Transcript_4524/g.6403 Transcript_4524/m.6403 type:complete len:206 (+) Transcript_4524:122-739(+)